MSTIIERRTTLGPSTSPRVPLPTPNIQPSHRLSAMSFQGVYGDTIGILPNVGSSTTVSTFSPASGNGPVLVEGPNGIPVMRFVEDPSAPDGQGNATLHSSKTGPAWRTLIAVARLVQLSSDPDSISAIFKGKPYAYQMTLQAASAGATTPGLLQSIGDSGTASAPGVQMTPGPNAQLQFVAVTLAGASTRLQVDSLTGTGSTTDYTTEDASFTIGFQKSNDYTFDLVEMEAHTTSLTPAQINEKRAFYRAIYQF